jgi:hypothetical protein
MSKKENKFDPPVGYMVGIQHHIVMVERLAVVLKINPVELAKKLEEGGFRLEPDFFDICADTWKVMDMQVQKEKPDLEVVK